MPLSVVSMAPKPPGKSKKIIGVIKLALEAGKATPASPVGPVLGSNGVNIMAFCKDYNARTADKPGFVIPVEIAVYDDKSFTFVLKTPPASVLLLKAAGVEKGSKDSTTESEYLAASEAAKEALWIRHFLEGLRVVPTVADLIPLFCDNSGVVFQAKEPKSSNKSRHLLKKFHVIRDYVKRKEILICKVGSRLL